MTMCMTCSRAPSTLMLDFIACRGAAAAEAKLAASRQPVGSSKPAASAPLAIEVAAEDSPAPAPQVCASSDGVPFCRSQLLCHATIVTVQRCAP